MITQIKLQLGLIRIEILSINFFVTIRRYLNETIDFRIGIILVFSFKSICTGNNTTQSFIWSTFYGRNAT